jgi:poly-gamma-glutamate synthesis protein (capsule biosynthesis protein)
VRVELAAVGDILMHEDVKVSGAQAPGGLEELWAEVTPELRKADIAFANLETPIAPATGRPGRPMQFNAPPDLPAALKASGFTILSTANNHAFDQGVRGVQETLDRLEKAGLAAIGTGPDRARAEAPRILEVKGLRIAFLGFTDIFNVNLDARADRPWVRSLDPVEAVRAVREARAEADAVVVSIHWGVEYLHTPLARQRKVARDLAEAGADLVLGHHPHVLQPVEVLEAGGRRTVVAYSLGNFISNQDRMYRADLFPVAGGDSRDGVLFRCRLVAVRKPDGTRGVRVENVRCEPLWTRNNWGEAGPRRIRVVPVTAGILEAEAELDALREAAPLDMPRILRAQEALRTLCLRRDRAASILGAPFVEGGPAGMGPDGAGR